jgi:hypothetical protein
MTTNNGYESESGTRAKALAALASVANKGASRATRGTAAGTDSHFRMGSSNIAGYDGGVNRDGSRKGNMIRSMYVHLFLLKSVWVLMEALATPSTFIKLYIRKDLNRCRINKISQRKRETKISLVSK